MTEPEAEGVLRLTKFDVAERQLLQAIQMFFEEQDPVSIHTLAEAASQVLHDIGRDRRISSFVRDSDCPRRSNFDPPCRLNFDPGLVAGIG